MSASDKKKTRHEQYVSQMTEKQQKEAKESKKLRLYTIIFAVVIVLMIGIVIATTFLRSGILERNTTAATINGDTKISAAELNHYYMDTVNQFMNQFSNYLSLTGLDSTKPLDEQIQNEETNTTWADYFLQDATKRMKSVYAVYNDAVTQGYTLSDTAKTQLDMTVSNMAAYAKIYGYPDANSYIKAVYGQGCNEETYRQYAEIQLIASEYAKDHSESLTYDDAALRAAEAENFNAYSSYSYHSYFVGASHFYEGGTTDADGKTTYSDEEKQAGLKAAEKAAQDLLDQKPATAEEFDKAIGAMSINADTDAKSTVFDRVLYSQIGQIFRDWVTDAQRTAGDMTVIPNETETTNEDGTTTKTVTGYYVVMFDGSTDNTFPLVNVRHILVPYEGGTTGENGQKTYTDEEKAAAKTKAEELLAQFTSGETTEDAFAALAKENSTDGGSKENGGLYEDVYPGQMVRNFNDWCFDESRKPGDTGIVESDYGVHVMYFVGDSETTYRDYMITNELRSADMAKWEESLAETVTVELVDTYKVNTDLVIGKK